MSRYNFTLRHLVDINRNKYTYDFGILSWLSKSVWESVYPVLYNDAGEPETSNFMVWYDTAVTSPGGTTYFKNSDKIEDNWVSKHGDMVYFRECKDEFDAMERFVKDCEAGVFSHLNELARMWQVIQMDYRPLFNKDVTDVKTVEGTLFDDVHSGSNKDIHAGEDVDTTEGQTEDRTQSSNRGKRVGTDLAQFEETTTEEVVPYNNETFYDKNKLTNTRDIEGVDNSSTNNVNYGISHTYDSNIEHTFDEETERTADYTETMTSRGNQGITMSQQMIESELKLRMTFAFWDVLYKMVIEPLLMYEV